jgi:multidrug efflux pump subunit AcrB
MYDAASTIMAQKLSQIRGVGQVIVGGSALPGVRIELNPYPLNRYGIGLEEGAQRPQQRQCEYAQGPFCGRPAHVRGGSQRSALQGVRVRTP